MRLNNRNKRRFWYALYVGTVEDYDDYGNQTGTHAQYSQPIEAWGNISPARGTAVEAQFGVDDRYDKVLLVDDEDTPIDETTVLWVDKSPYELPVGTQSNNGLITDVFRHIVVNLGPSQDVPYYSPWDYVVRRVGRGLPGFGAAVIAISKVDVS